MKKLKVNFKKLSPEAQVPTYGTEGAACFDLYALQDAVVRGGSATTVHTGVAVEVPPGHVMLVFSRSGMGYNHALRLSNCVGVIDSDYRGEVVARLHQDSVDPARKYRIKAGDRVAQALIVPIPTIELVEVKELGSTSRGTKGFGSTGS